MKYIIIGGLEMKFKKLSILFTLILALSTFFSSFAFAEGTSKPNLVALGDSISFGYNLGDTNNNTNPSPSAFPNLIQSGNFNVTNLGVPGLISTRLLANLSIPAAQAAIGNADVITLFIGSNDLLQDPEVKLAMEKLAAAPSEGFPPGTLELILNAAIQAANEPKELIESNLNKIFNSINQINPNAQVILYNLYNPFGAGNLKVLLQKKSLN
jgi:lysophospholipase L1-like esterase